MYNILSVLNFTTATIKLKRKITLITVDYADIKGVIIIAYRCIIIIIGVWVRRTREKNYKSFE